MRSIRLWNSLLLKVVRAEWFELHHSNSSHGITFTLSTESVSIKKKLLLYMCVKHSTLRKAKDNVYFFTFSTFLVIIFLLLGTPVLFFVCLFVLFCFYASGRQKNWKMQSVHNVECEVFFFILQRVKIKMKLSPAIWMFYFSWMEEHLKCWGVIWCRICTITVPGIYFSWTYSPLMADRRTLMTTEITHLP